MDNEMTRITWMPSLYSGSCEGCTEAKFNTIIRDACVRWKRDTRRAVRRAVREGLPLDKFTCDTDYQKWELQQLAMPRVGEKFASMCTAERLLKWVDYELKPSMPGFVYCVSEFGLVPREDKKGNPLLDENGQPILYRRRVPENICHLSGLFYSDYDHLPFDPLLLYERTLKPDYPWRTALAHITSSGEGLRIVSECIIGQGYGNVADQIYLQAKELGVLNLKGTTGKYVCDNAIINPISFSFTPCIDDILYIDNQLLFNF